MRGNNGESIFLDDESILFDHNFVPVLLNGYTAAPCDWWSPVTNASNARHYELEAVTDDGRRLDLVQIGADQDCSPRRSPTRRCRSHRPNATT